ncbi:hypothetical protein ACJMK2_019109 [Sinanodonta woodiana]|uniref:Transcription termination factor 5, mitochondrial n=1 Tax=Sinanodonta woodiana TaxID=1069815 RepID=A0ABD3UFR9_SINWO
MMATQIPKVPLFLGVRKLWCFVCSSRCLSSKLRTLSYSLERSTKEISNDDIQLTKQKPPALKIYDTPASKIDMEKQTLNARTDKQNLKATLEILLDLGCTEDQIRENAVVLNFTPQEIEKRVKFLRSCAQKRITVELLLHATEKHKKKFFVKKDQFNEEILHGFSSKTEYLAHRLKCSLDDIRKIHCNHIQLATITSQSLVKKLDFLLETGYTDKEILKTPECLTVPLANLRKRFNLCGKLNLMKLPDLKIIGASKMMFHKYMSRPKDYLEVFQEYEDSYDLVSKLLAIPPSRTEHMMKVVRHMDIVDLRNKIQYLLSEDLKPSDIIESSYLLRYSLGRIKNAVEQTKVMLGRQISLVNIASLIVSGRRGSNIAMLRNHNILMMLLELNHKQICSCEEVRLVTKRTKKVLEENYTFLLDKGFSVTDLRSCPLILGHDTETLIEGYEFFMHTLENNLTLQIHCEDGIKKINILQYLIEKDLNFPGVVSLYEEDENFGEEEGEEVEDGSKSEHYGVDDE